MRQSVVLALALLLWSGPPATQEDAAMNRPVTIPHTEVFDIHSEQANLDFQLWVATPVEGAIPLPPGPRPVLYVLDANLFFSTAVEMTRIMSQLFGELPPLLVVGVAYDTDQPALQAELRSRDFTPTVDTRFASPEAMPPGAPPPTLPPDERAGRAAEFLAFLTQEAVPFIEARYDVAPGDSTLFGSSLGGLFVLHTFVEEPDAFDAYLAVSPALWWDDAVVMHREAELAPSRPDLHTRLFLAVGSGEERNDMPMLAPFRMISNLQEFASRLESRGYENLSLRTFIADGESHTSVVPVALTRGLRFIYESAAGPRVP